MKDTVFIGLGLSTFFADYTGLNALIQPVLIKTNIEVTSEVLDLILKSGEILVAYLSAIVLVYKVYGFLKEKRQQRKEREKISK